MDRSIVFLPAFDEASINSYFRGNRAVVSEIFKITQTSLQGDLEALRSAYDARDVYGVREATHKIKPVFNIIGLPAIGEQVYAYYKSILNASHFDNIKPGFEDLWMRLLDARGLVNEQARLLSESPN